MGGRAALCALVLLSAGTSAARVGPAIAGGLASSAGGRTASLPAATARPLGPPPSACDSLSVSVVMATTGDNDTGADPTTGRHTLAGTVVIRNSGPNVAALDRVGLRLCSRSAAGHVRVEATCPDDDGGGPDVLPGKSLVCTWRIELPAPPAVGSALSDWTGIFSGATLALFGDRCASPVVDPTTGRVGGSCTAAPDP